MIQPASSTTWETVKKAPHFPCPHCGKQLRHDTNRIGQRVMCPGCRQAFVLHRLSAQVDQDSKPILNYHRAPKRRRRTNKNKWLIILITCACHILVLLWGIAFLKDIQEEKRLANQANQANAISRLDQRSTPAETTHKNNFMEKFFDTVTGRSIEDKIIGEWEEIDGEEEIEFLSNGNAILTHPITNNQPLAVDYEFLNKECSKIRMDILHIPMVFSVDINDNILKLEAGPGPNQFSFYRRVSS